MTSISLPCFLQRYDEECGSKEDAAEFETLLRNCQCFKNRRCSFPCDVCGKHFDYMFLLEKHFLIHNQLNLFNCDICGRENVLFCPHCDLSFLQETEYISHLKVHGKEFVFHFQCTFCDYKSNCPSDFKKHFQVHSEKNYKFSCDVCEYKTNRHADLKRHHFVHTQEKPFVCAVCGKAFNQKKVNLGSARRSLFT